MFYKTRSEAVKIRRQDLAVVNDFFLAVGDAAASYDFHDTKEKARLEFYYELLEKYNYPVARIEFDAAVFSENGDYSADIAVFKDDKRKIPYIVIDCFKDEISKVDFENAVKNIIVKAEAFGADFAVCANRVSRKIIKLTRTNGVVSQKIASDLPAGYGII